MAGSARGFPVTLESWGWSQKGDIRPENQDSFLSWNERLLWAVADGVGSSAHGGEAGRLVTRMLLTTPHAASLDEHVNNVGGILRQGNDILRAHGGATQAASTVVALLMHGGEAACLWAGDSRCYLLQDGVLYQCTREHTLRQEKIDNGELTAPEARRMVRGNIITNAVGARDALRLDEVRFSLRGGDKFLLCSDGLSNLLGPDALAARLARTSAREAAEDMARAVDGVPQPDNITLVAVFVSSLR